MDTTGFTPMQVQPEPEFFDGFRTHLWLAFREFDPNFYETYVFVIVIFFTLLWATFSVLQWLCNCGKTKEK